MSDEHDPLIVDSLATSSHPLQCVNNDEPEDDELYRTVHRVVPISFIASFGLSATVATSVFAFAYIVCVDPLDCQDEEKRYYSGLVAVATTIANVCAVTAVGPLHILGKRNGKIGLMLWLVCRASSIAILGFAVVLKSIPIAIVSKLVEGLATDNILQYGLGAVYVNLRNEKQFSSIMGKSMAFYLLGACVGPIFAGISKNFRVSFLIAICVFVFAFTYLLFLPLSGRIDVSSTNNTNIVGASSDAVNEDSTLAKYDTPFRTMRYIFLHLSILNKEPTIILPAAALFVFTTAQAYIFSATMVHTSVQFGFTGRENGYLLSLAAGTSAIFLFTTPIIISTFEKNFEQQFSRVKLNFIMAITTILALATSLILLAATRTAWHIYPIMVLLSLGLGASTFIKSYTTLILQAPADGVPVFAVMECLGAMASPVIIGGAQAKLHEGVWFFISCGMMGLAIVLLVSSRWTSSTHRNRPNGHSQE